MIRRRVFAVAVVALVATTVQVRADSIRTLTDLTGVTIFERTGGTEPDALTYAPDSTEMTTRLASLELISADYISGANEYYDFFYSDADGTFNLDGEYITVEALYLGRGAGHNIAGVQLNFDSGDVLADITASYNLDPVEGILANVGFAADGNLLTHTFMGQSGDNDDRLRVTVGFSQFSGNQPEIPEPASAVLLVGGLAVLARRRR